MKFQLNGIIKSNWFFVALICFVLVLPLSQALVSIFSGVLLFVALVEDSLGNKLQRLKQRRIILLIPIIFLLYVASSFVTLNGIKPFYDVQKTMFYLVIPLAFSLGKEIDSKQKRIVFYAFISSVFLATVVTLYNWKFSADNINFSVHTASPISHIRFSFQLILVFWFLLFHLNTNFTKVKTKWAYGFVFLACYFLLFIFFQQSLTGIIALAVSFVFMAIYFVYSSQQRLRIPFSIACIILFLIPLFYIGFVVNKFYDIEKVSQKNIDKITKHGNAYQHNFNNKAVENGKYVHLYVCADEMREEWNKVSNFKYDESGNNGYPIYSTLIRYLTSKGLHKDAEGVKALSKRDIENVENGIANVIFQKKYSIYPRIYQTVWEYYVYTNTGYVNHQSFSQRIEFAKAAITIIKNNFWLGVGTGNWRTEFAAAFKANNSQLNESLYASSHNQYLNFMVKFGCIGFILILFLLIYPIVKTKRYHDSLFLVFLVYMFFANFADSNLETHMGSSFFLFFYCFFITTNGIDYLKIGKS